MKSSCKCGRSTKECASPVCDEGTPDKPMIDLIAAARGKNNRLASIKMINFLKDIYIYNPSFEIRDADGVFQKPE